MSAMTGTSPSMRMPAAFRALALSTPPPQSPEIGESHVADSSTREVEDSAALNGGDLPSTPKQSKDEVLEDEETMTEALSTPLAENSRLSQYPSSPVTPSVRHAYSSPSLTKTNGTSPSTPVHDTMPSQANGSVSNDAGSFIRSSTSQEPVSRTISNRRLSLGHHRKLNSEFTGFLDKEYLASDRDWYGFKKTMGFKTIEDHNDWWIKYRQHLIRRKKKWEKLIGDNGGYLPPSTIDSESDDKKETVAPSRFPSRSDTVKRYIRKGIPYEWRGNAWFHYAKGEEVLKANVGLYDKLCRDTKNLKNNDTEFIERDLHRTLPENIHFRTDNDKYLSHDQREETKHIQSLRRVLIAFSVYHPKIGYCQSLNFIAGTLLLFMNEERAFWMLHIVTQKYLPGVHEVNLEGVNIDHGVLMLYMKQSLPSFWQRLCVNFDGQHYDDFLSRLPPISLCITAWFMGAYVTILPPETMLRVWDCMFYEGPKIIFRVALAIFKLCEPRVKGITDQMETFQFIQNFPKGLTDPIDFLDTCFKEIESIKDDELIRMRKFVSDRRKLANSNQNINTTNGYSNIKTSNDLEAYKIFRSSTGKTGLTLNFHLKHQLRSITVRSRRIRSTSTQAPSNTTSNNVSLSRRISSFPRKSLSLRSSAASSHSP